MLENIVFRKDHYSTDLKLIYKTCEIINQDPEWIYIKIDKKIIDDFYQIKRDITHLINRNPEMYCDAIKTINVDQKLRGFDQDWDVSKINKSDILDILLNKHKFTKTLQNILKNEVNLNVIINNDKNGFVYKSENDKYEPMKEDQIMQQSMNKIYKNTIEKYYYAE